MTTIASPQRGGTASVDVEGALRAAGAAHLSSSGQAYLAGRLEARQNFAFVEDRSFNLGGLRDVDGPVAARKREGLASFATLDDAAHALVQVAYRAAPRRWAEVGDAEMAALDAYPTRAPRETFRKLMADWEAFDRMRVGEAVLPAARADSVAWREARDAFLTRGLPSDAGHTARAADEALKREVLRARAVRRELRIVSVVDVYDPRGGVSKSAAAGLARHVPNAVTFLGHGLTILVAARWTLDCWCGGPPVRRRRRVARAQARGVLPLRGDVRLGGRRHAQLGPPGGARAPPARHDPGPDPGLAEGVRTSRGPAPVVEGRADGRAHGQARPRRPVVREGTRG